MKGDFARFTFDPARHYSRVLQQQGRVSLEADWNEQAAIQLHLLRALAMDLAGPAWAAGDGFSMLPQGMATLPEKPGDWPLSAGHFYVDGMLCENNRDHTTLASQPYSPTPDDGADQGTPGADSRQAPFVVWLDVWERHVSSVEAPAIIDVALGGADTATRAQVIWQLRLFDPVHAGKWLDDTLTALRARLLAASRTGDDTAVVDRQIIDMKNLHVALADMGHVDTDQPDAAAALVHQVLDVRASWALPHLRATLPAVAGSDSRAVIAGSGYLGSENQLYRVEIHRGGPVASEGAQGATFKWSRDNGATVFPIVGYGAPAMDGRMRVGVILACPGGAARFDLAVGDWVELLDDDCTLAQCDTFPLLQVIALTTGTPHSSVTLRVPDRRMPYLPDVNPQRHPLLRRWDQRGTTEAADVLDVIEGGPIALEAGISITFEPGGLYAHGDYWTIPARVAGGGTLDWPRQTGIDGQPARDDHGHPVATAVPAAGRHHYAVLGCVDAEGGYHEYCRRIDSHRR
ncbi:MAG: DUF6519 domain-containing protein [Rhodanobacter sp.]